MKAVSVKFRAWIAGTAGAVVLYALRAPSMNDCLPITKTMRAKGDMTMIRVALAGYHCEYSILPEGSDPDIIRNLLGDNPHKMKFMGLRANQMDSRGRFIDPWGSPYHLITSDPENPKAYSLGRNKTDEHNLTVPDDVCSWR